MQLSIDKLVPLREISRWFLGNKNSENFNGKGKGKDMHKLPSIDFEKLKTFYISVELGKFSLAARELKVDHSTVTRQIQSLEKKFNGPLFERWGFRGLKLTEKGKQLYKISKELLNKVAEIEPILMHTDEGLEGSLRIWVHEGYTLTFICSCLGEFMRKYPLIHLEIISGQDMKDVSIREVDIVIGPNIESKGNVIEKKILGYTLKLYASQRYIEEHGLPETREDLKNHQFASCFTESKEFFSKANWYLEFQKESTIEPLLVSSSNVLKTKLAKEGLVICSLAACFEDIEKNELVEVLPDLIGPTIFISMVYASHFKKSEKVAALYGFLKEKSKAFVNK